MGVDFCLGGEFHGTHNDWKFTPGDRTESADPRLSADPARSKENAIPHHPGYHRAGAGCLLEAKRPGAGGIDLHPDRRNRRHHHRHSGGQPRRQAGRAGSPAGDAGGGKPCRGAAPARSLRRGAARHRHPHGLALPRPAPPVQSAALQGADAGGDGNARVLAENRLCRNSHPQADGCPQRIRGGVV